MDRAQYRKDKLAHCQRFVDLGDSDYAIWAADWYEKNEPWHLSGLGARVRQEIEKHLLEKQDERDNHRVQSHSRQAATAAGR